MKKLLIALLLVTNIAHADEWLEMPNKAGGKIILVFSSCVESKNGKLAMATLPEGDTLHGCWYYFADMIHIAWKDGRTSSFNPNDFTARRSK